MGQRWATTQRFTFPSSAGEAQVLVHRPTTIVYTSASLAEGSINIVTCNK